MLLNLLPKRHLERLDRFYIVVANRETDIHRQTTLLRVYTVGCSSGPHLTLCELVLGAK